MPASTTASRAVRGCRMHPAADGFCVIGALLDIGKVHCEIHNWFPGCPPEERHKLRASELLSGLNVYLPVPEVMLRSTAQFTAS